VEYGNHRQAIVAVLPRHDVEEALRVCRVKMGRRFVEEEDLRRLRKRHREGDALAFTPGKFLHKSIPELGRVGRRQGAVDGATICPVITAPEGAMCGATEANKVCDGDIEGRVEPLRQPCDASREITTPMVT
jgi:hypothetical protein